MAILNDALTFARAGAQTDSNGLSDINGILFANEALFDFHRRLVDSSIDASQIQEVYRDGSIPTTGNGATFLYPSDMLFLKTIEVNFTDTTPQNYMKAEQVDQSNLAGSTSFSWLRVNQDKNNPKFADNGDWYEIFPAFSSGDNITQAIRLIYFTKPSEFATTADTISYPSSLDYRLLSWRIMSSYYYSLNKFGEGDAFNARYEDRVKQLIATLGRGTQQPIQVGVLNVGSNGWAF